jgi:hypothetical protein
MDHALYRFREFLTDASAESRLRALGETHGVGATDVIAVILLPAFAPPQKP